MRPLSSGYDYSKEDSKRDQLRVTALLSVRCGVASQGWDRGMAKCISPCAVEGNLNRIRAGSWSASRSGMRNLRVRGEVATCHDECAEPFRHLHLSKCALDPQFFFGSTFFRIEMTFPDLRSQLGSLRRFIRIPEPTVLARALSDSSATHSR